MQAVINIKVAEGIQHDLQDFEAELEVARLLIIGKVLKVRSSWILFYWSHRLSGHRCLGTAFEFLIY